MEKVFGLESGNGFLFEPDLCKSYYADLKSKISANSEIPYVFKYLNITFMPKYLSLVNTNSKNNEIIILRTENSNLKGAIEQYEKKLLQKENEITKLNLSFEKDKSELLLKIKILNEELKRKKCTNYFRFKMTKKKINNNLKKSNDISRTLSNDSNELINNNHLTLNLLRTSDNSNILNYSGRTKIRDDKLNTLFFEKINTINYSRKNSYNCNKKIQEKFKSSYKDNNIIIKVNESYNIINNNNLNKHD